MNNQLILDICTNMQALPLISIITTYYNSVQLGDFVKSSMNCLLNQTYSNIEFICVNDGSTDSTLDNLEYFAKKTQELKFTQKKIRGMHNILKPTVRIRQQENLSSCLTMMISLILIQLKNVTKHF